MNIIPQPKKLEKISGQFTIEQGDTVYCDDQYRLQVERFAQMVEYSANISLILTDEIDSAKIIFSKDDSNTKDSYFIMLSQGVATIKCGDIGGCFYAVETLRQLFQLDFPQESVTCGNCYIEDVPKFRHRGLLIDICRHFFGVDVLKQIIDVMAQVKLNKLHLHLSDDQGFRIQIDKYPLLNTVSSVRNGSQVVKNGKQYVDDTVVEGYLTKADVKQLVEYAAERNIEIIPEIDLPGHFVAALAAYPQYSCSGQVAEVRKLWGISKDILCAGNDDTYKFVCDVLNEVAELFPSQYFHLGGDEAPKDRWCNCRLCREKLSQLQLSDFDELQTYMVEYFRKHLQEKGKTVICWNDGMTKSANENIVMQVWKPFTTKQGAREANNGRQVIMSPFFKLYFDYPYAMTPLSKTWRYNPLKGVKLANRGNILGVEGCLWTEYVENTDKLFFNLLPRLDALAECGWGYRRSGFSKRLRTRFDTYSKMGIAYNSKARLNACRHLSVINKFYKKDADVELHRYINKQK